MRNVYNNTKEKTNEKLQTQIQRGNCTKMKTAVLAGQPEPK